MSYNHFILQEDPRGGSQSKKPSTTRSSLFKDKYKNRKDGTVHIKNVKWMATFWYQSKIRYNRWFLQTKYWNTSQFLPPRIRFTKWPETLIEGTIIPTKYNTHVRHHMIHGLRHLGVIKKNTKRQLERNQQGWLTNRMVHEFISKYAQIYIRNKNATNRMDFACALHVCASVPERRRRWVQNREFLTFYFNSLFKSWNFFIRFIRFCWFPLLGAVAGSFLAARLKSSFNSHIALRELHSYTL